MKKERKIITILSFCFIINVTFAQNCIEKLPELGFQYYAIEEKNYTAIDSIDFFISTPINPSNPTVLFLQGSGNYSLMVYNDFGYAVLLPPFDIKSYANRYNFIVISKPATPICKQLTLNEMPPLLDTTNAHARIFVKMDNLDYYVSQTYQVMQFLKTNILKKTTPIYLIGNSQGGHVATTFTAQYPDLVQKLVLYSCGIFDRYVEEILEWRLKSDRKEISAEEATEKINRLYIDYQGLKEWKAYFQDAIPNEKKANFWEDVAAYSRDNSCSFNFDISLDHLLQINIPILAVYGTEDLKARDNELLPLFFIRANKTNLTMMPVNNCNHFFVEKTMDSQTGEIKEEYVGDKVFADIEKWFKK
jgi:pimeloyl-ACP methyl ester carboxylesterase